MGFHGVATALALLAAIVAVGAVRDLSSYTFGKHQGALDFDPPALDLDVRYIPAKQVNPWKVGKKVVTFYDPVGDSPKKKVFKKHQCGEGKVLVTNDEGRYKCVNKEEEIPVEGCPEATTAVEGPDGEITCVFTCPEGFKQIGDTEECEEDVFTCPEGLKQIGDTKECEEIVFTCPEGQKQIGDTKECEEIVFTCPEGFKQIGDTEECEEDVPEVQNVSVPAEAPLVEEPVVEAVTVPEEEATAPAPSPEEPVPVPETPVPEEPVPVPETPVPEEPVPVPEVPVPEEPVPVPEAPVPEVEVEVVPEPEAPGKCPVNQFYMEKVEARGCQPCDSNCEDSACVDLVGCGTCKPGYFTQREDVDWPYECVLCDSVLPGCGKCKDNITLELGETPQCEG